MTYEDATPTARTTHGWEKQLLREKQLCSYNMCTGVDRLSHYQRRCHWTGAKRVQYMVAASV